VLKPEYTYAVLLVVQALHLLHHRLARRHISFAEVASAAALCIPVSAAPAALLVVLHLVLAGVQIVGSIWINKLSPNCDGSPSGLARMG